MKKSVKKFSKKSMFWNLLLILIIFIEIILLSYLGKFIASLFLAGFICVIALVVYSIYYKKMVIIVDLFYWQYGKKSYPTAYWIVLGVYILISLLLFIGFIRYFIYS
jgi:hypothetical protein